MLKDIFKIRDKYMIFFRYLNFLRLKKYKIDFKKNINKK